MVQAMSALRARVQNARLLLDAPTDLPEGTVLNLIVDDEGDEGDDHGRTELDDAISRAAASIQAGHFRSAVEVLASLRKRQRFVMSKPMTNNPDLLEEYDFSNAEVGRYAKGTNVVVLDPDVAAAFKTSEAVNNALREHLKKAAG